MLKRETVTREENGLFGEPDGDIIEVLMASRDRVRLLTRVPEPETQTLEEAGEGDDEDAPDYRWSDDNEPYCIGNDNTCGRTVDEPGTKCWQHDDD